MLGNTITQLWSCLVRVFISYNNRDRAIAERMTTALDAVLPEFSSYFAPRSNIGGSYWVPRLGEELQRADAVLLLLGTQVGSWQELEYYEALRLTRAEGRPRIIPVLLGDDSPGLYFLGQQHRLRMDLQPYDALIDQLKTALSGIDSARDTLPPWHETNPYRGLHAMRSADAAYFFGREGKTGEILDLLRRHPNRILALVGNSGVGKSSIVEAGVIASLRSRLWPGDIDRGWPADLRDSASWLIMPLRPGERPLHALATAFVRSWIDDAADVEAQASKWVTNFQNCSSLSTLIDATRYKIAERAEADPPQRFLIYVDQGEELYARSESVEAARFSELLAGAVSRDDLVIMASLRADYYGRLQEDAALFPVCERVDIPALDRKGLETVIRRPVDSLGARFQDPAVVDIIADAAARQKGALPLLSYMMSEAWETMRGDDDSSGTLRFPVGVIDVSGPLVRKADQFLDQHPHDHETLRRLFTLRLAHVPKNGEPVRRRATRAECSAEEWSLAEKLASADWRLLTAGEHLREPTIEVAHEALLRSWPHLARWIGDEREFLIWKGRIEASQLEWEATPPEQRDEAVLMGLALETARRWHGERRDDLGPKDRVFIESSLQIARTRRKREDARGKALEDARARAEQRRKLLTKAAVIFSCVLAALLTLVAWQWREGQKTNFNLTTQLFETQKEQARFRIGKTTELLQADQPDQALALAIAAYPYDVRARWSELDSASDGWSALLEAYSRSRLLVGLRGHESSVDSAEFSPGGDRVLTAAADGTARIWDVASGKELRRLLCPDDGRFNSAIFSSKGDSVLTASSDGTARIWNADNGKESLVMLGHENPVFSAVFSADGNRVVTASSDGTARLWDADSGAKLHVLRGHDGWVTNAIFSPDSNRVLTSSVDGTARIWDSASGAELLMLGGSHENWISSSVFSPKGDRVLSVGSDSDAARIWDAASGEEALVLRGHTGRVRSAIFSSEGDLILTASDDKTARIWDAATGTELLVLRGHEDWLNGAVFSFEDDRVLTASVDGTARVWDAASGAELQLLRAPDHWAFSASFSRKGDRVLTAYQDGTARIWDIANGAQVLVLRGHKSEVNSAVFSSKDDLVLTASDDETARIWDAASGAELLVLGGHKEGVYSAVFSPKDNRIVTVSDDGTARIWDAASGVELQQYGGFERYYISCAVFSPDGNRVLIGSNDGSVRVLDAASGAEQLLLRGQGWVRSAVFSSDGNRVLTASDDDTARIYDAVSGAELVVLRGHDRRLMSAVFSSDGDRVLTASEDGTARIWDAESAEELLILPSMGRAVFSSEGDLALTVTDDGAARIWDTVSGAELLVLRWSKGAVKDAVFSSNDDHVVTISDEGTVRVLNLIPLSILVDMAVERVRRARTFSRSEECKYFLRADCNSAALREATR